MPSQCSQTLISSTVHDRGSSRSLTSCTQHPELCSTPPSSITAMLNPAHHVSSRTGVLDEGCRDVQRQGVCWHPRRLACSASYYGFIYLSLPLSPDHCRIEIYRARGRGKAQGKQCLGQKPNLTVAMARPYLQGRARPTKYTVAMKLMYSVLPHSKVKLQAQGKGGVGRDESRGGVLVCADLPALVLRPACLRPCQEIETKDSLH